jgi:hypothetical protein
VRPRRRAARGQQRVHGRPEQGGERPKLLGLVALVVEHHEALELDLADRGVDLLDLWRGRLSPRRLELLIRDLPPTSRLVRSLDPDAAAANTWGTTEYLLAYIADLLGQANFQNYKPLQRPAEAAAEKRRTEERHRRLIERYEARQRAARSAGGD